MTRANTEQIKHTPWFAKAGAACSIVPISRFVGPNIFALKGGGYGCLFSLIGLDEEALTDLELEARVRQVEGALRGQPHALSEQTAGHHWKANIMKITYFPCVRGTMGDWTYYTTVMSVADLVTYVKFAEEISPNRDLDSMIQREVSNRAKDIAEYLRTNDQRFFGSLIVAAYDGKPRFRSFASPIHRSLMRSKTALAFYSSTVASNTTRWMVNTA